MTRCAWWLSSLVLALALPARAQAPPAEEPAEQPPAVRVSVGAGLTGSWTGSGWVACEVLIDNGHPIGRQAEVVFEAVRDGDPRWTCRRRVQLAARGKRREWFQAPLGEGSVTLQVQVFALDAAGAPAARLGGASRPVAVVRATGEPQTRTALYLSGRASATVDAVQLLKGGTFSSPLQLEHRRVEDLPAEAFGLRGLHLVVLHEADLSRASAEQRAVLLEWVERGGDVLLIPGRNSEGWFRSPGVRELAGQPVGAYRVDRLPRTERLLGERLVPPGQAREDFQVYVLPGAEQLEAPREGNALTLEERRRFGHSYSLLQKRRRGHGAVFLLATDLTLPPFSTWRRTQSLVDVVNATLEDTASRGRKTLPIFQRPEPCERPALGDLLDSNQRPSLALVVVLVLAYLVCVGPLNVHALRRRSPLVLALAVPAVALLFTVLTIVGGFLTKGLGTVVWRVSVTTAAAGATRGVEQTAVSLRSSVADRHSLRFAPGLRATRVFRGADAVEAARQELRDDEGFVFAGVRLDTWEQGVFEASGDAGLGKGLTLTPTGDEWTLDNGTGRALLGAVVLDANDVLRRAGPLDDGASGSTSLLEAVRRDGAAARDAVARALCADPVEARIAADALAEYLGGRLPQGVVVVARLARAPSRIAVDGDEDPDREVALLVVTPTRLEVAPVTAPPATRRRGRRR